MGSIILVAVALTWYFLIDASYDFLPFALRFIAESDFYSSLAFGFANLMDWDSTRRGIPVFGARAEMNLVIRKTLTRDPTGRLFIVIKLAIYPPIMIGIIFFLSSPVLNLTLILNFLTFAISNYLQLFYVRRNIRKNLNVNENQAL